MALQGSGRSEGDNDDIRHNDGFTFHGAPALFCILFLRKKSMRRGMYSALTRQSNITSQTSVAALAAIIGFH